MMVFLVCPVTKDTGATQDHWDLQALQGKTERGEMMEKSDPGASQVNQDLVVCSGPKVPLVSLDLLVFEEMMGTRVPKEIWVHKESLDLLDNREPQELRGCLDLRDTLDPQEKKVPLENPVCQECLELMALLVTQERRGLLAPKETRVLMVLRELLVILGLVASRESKEFVD